MEVPVPLTLETVLKKPAYGYEKNGQFYRPTTWEIFKEVLSNINIYKSKKNWVGFLTVLNTCYLLSLVPIWFIYDYSWQVLLAGFVMGFLAPVYFLEIYVHRFIHGAVKFRNNFWRNFVKYCTLRGIPDEVHIVAHNVHHAYSDKKCDPYNASGGALYCFFSDINHQRINPNLSEQAYEKLCKQLEGFIRRPNSYEQYKKWGSVEHPLHYSLEVLAQWILFSCIFYVVGGFPLIHSVFGMYALSSVLIVRNVNYFVHNYGKRKKRKGLDFCENDFSSNNLLCGFIGTNWHDNHHNFQKSAKTGFLWWQLDIPWLIIRFLHFVGIITSYNDATKSFEDRVFLNKTA